MAEGMKLYEAGVRYTKEEADARSVEVPLEGGGSEQLVFTTEEMEQRKWAWVYGELERQGAERMKEQERARARERTRLWLEHIGSPLAPYTDVMQREADRVGSNVYMCAAVSMAESSGALACHGCNAWGLGGATNYRTFGSWEDGIAAFYQFLYDWDISNGYSAVDGHTTPNYCEPNEPWMTNVDQTVRDIQAVNVP